MDNDLLRQRRNLLLISCGLILYHLAGVEITGLGLLGTQLTVKNPHVLSLFSWILWCYFLIRYLQYWLSDKRTTIRLAFKDAMFKRTHTTETMTRIQKKAKQPNANPAIRWKRGLPGYYVARANLEAGTDYLLIERINPIKYIAWLAGSIGSVALLTKHFTDYLLPLVIAVSAPVIAMAVHHDVLAIAT